MRVRRGGCSAKREGVPVDGGDYSWSPTAGPDRAARAGLPNNTEAEANVLAAMMLSGEVVEEALV